MQNESSHQCVVFEKRILLSQSFIKHTFSMLILIKYDTIEVCIIMSNFNALYHQHHKYKNSIQIKCNAVVYMLNNVSL